MVQFRQRLLHQVSAQIPKVSGQTPSSGLTAGEPPHRRSFSSTSGTPPLMTPPQASEAQTSRTSGSQAGSPPAVKQALGDIAKIAPRAPREQRAQQIQEIGERYLERLRQCADTPTPSGRSEFLASNLMEALDRLPEVLGKWVDTPSGLAFDSKAHEPHLHDRRQVFQSLLDNPRKAAVYASVVHPSLRDKYGINMSQREMASLGVADKGPYLSESELMMLCDYAHHLGDTFNAKRALDVLAQQLGPTGLAFKAHMGPEVGVFGSALDKLGRHPGCSVRGDFTKGMRLVPFQEKGLTLLCQSGKPYPIETATSAARDPKDSYINRPGYNAEVVFRNAQGVDISDYQSTATQGESEVAVLPRAPLLGVGTQLVSTPDPERGGAEKVHTCYVFEATPASTGKSPA